MNRTLRKTRISGKGLIQAGETDFIIRMLIGTLLFYEANSHLY